MVTQMPLKSYYNTILSQVYSPCGNYLVVGDIYGVISVFNLQKIINPDYNLSDEDRKPKNTFTIKCDIQINSLLSTHAFLLVGIVGEICAYKWAHVKSSKDVKPAWKIEIPNAKRNFQKNEINCILHNEKTGQLYVGCGDDYIYVIDMEMGKVVTNLKGHDNYIHCIVQLGNELVSGGEDGLVNLWDLRSKQVTNSIEPHKNNKVQRTDLGKWIGAVSINEDWLLCGGGPRLSLWHYRSLNNTIVFPLEDRGIHIAQFHQDTILAGGRIKYFYQMNLNGDIISEIPTSSVSIYSAIYQEEPFKALCLSGSSRCIDICSNLNYRDQVLTLV